MFIEYLLHIQIWARALGQVQVERTSALIICFLARKGNEPTGKVTRAAMMGQRPDSSPKTTQTASPSQGSAVDWPTPFPRECPRVPWQIADRGRERWATGTWSCQQRCQTVVTWFFIYHNMCAAPGWGICLGVPTEVTEQGIKKPGLGLRKASEALTSDTNLQGMPKKLSDKSKLYFRAIF